MAVPVDGILALENNGALELINYSTGSQVDSLNFSVCAFFPFYMNTQFF